MERDKLESRWNQLCKRLGKPEVAGSLWTLLQALYRHPKRTYHAIEHAWECVEHLYKIRDEVEITDFDAAELAIWLHDCVYVAGSPKNEEESAEIGIMFCEQLGFDSARTKRVAAIILGTKHTGEPLKGDAAVVADIDLSSIGTPRADFARGSAMIAKEFAHIPKDKYIAGRIKFLGAMLDRKRIFHTQYMWDRMEAQARRNLRIELERHIAARGA